MKILVSNPESDDITRYLHAWSKKMIQDFADKHEFTHLVGERANQNHFCGLLAKGYHDIVFINGHGSDSMITGYNKEVLIDSNNVTLLSGKTVRALSCHTAKTLGKLAIQNGAKGYVGYDERFVLMMRSGNLSHPLDDDLAQLFLDPAFTAPRALLNHKTPTESVKLAQKAYQRSIINALNSDVQSDQEQCVPYLWHDLKHLKAFE